MQDPEWSEESLYQDIDLIKPTPFQQHADLSSLTVSQIKRRQVIKSLIDTEQSYIDCLNKLVKDCQPMITSLLSSRPQVMTAFIYLRLMLIQHVKSHEKLKDGSYQNVTDFFREAQGTSSIEALMLRPVQRFPQFILILKDLLKYTPDDDVENIQLQNCLILLEHVGHQLNERKRRSEKTLQAQTIYAKVKLSPSADRGNHWLVRQDDVRQLCQVTNGKQPLKQRRLILMNACIVSVCMSSSSASEDYTMKWSVSLQHLDLNEQSMTPGLALKDENTDILTELNKLKDDYTTLEQMIDIAKTLNRTYPDVLDTLERNRRSIQQNIQNTFNTTGIELIDSLRNRTYAFLFDNSKTKQEWCIDFIISKNALDSSNNPVWSVQGETIADSVLSPACFIRPLKADAPRQFTKAKCVTQVIMPFSDNNNMGLPHLWVCSATEGLGNVSIISIHSGRPNLLESFKACQCEILCAEMIPCSAEVQHVLAFSMDTVWMGTVDSEIIVFAVSSPQNGKRTPLRVFHTTGVVVTLKYVKDRVFAGCRTGTLQIFTTDKDGVWADHSNVVIGHSPVSTFLLWQSDIWVGCGNSLFVFNVDTLTQKPSIHFQTEEACDETINCMVQTGQGVWLSYIGMSIMRLYHMATGKLLQEYDVNVDLNTFCADTLKGCFEFHNSLKHEITSLMSCPGFLWVGTSSGMILNYPTLLNQESGPQIIMRPNISMHGYCGSAKFISIMPFGSVASRSLPSRFSDLNLKSMKHGDADYRHSVSDKKVSDVSSTNTNLYDSHVYMTLLPESSSSPSVPEEGTLFSSNTIQMTGNSELVTGDITTRISLNGDILRKGPVRNNQVALQDNSNRPTIKDPCQEELLTQGKTLKGENQGQPPISDTRSFANDDIPEQRTETFMQRADSGYNLSRDIEGGELSHRFSPRNTNAVLTVPSGRLKRQSAIRLSHVQSVRDYISSAKPISRSGSWKIENTNKYVIISGGDGYRDWKNRDPFQYRNNEALLLSWIVKI